MTIYMTDKTYNHLLSKMKEISDLTPQRVGPLTPLYRIIIPFFKRDPWRPILLSSMVLTALLYIALGASIVWIVSMLQHGF